MVHGNRRISDKTKGDGARTHLDFYFSKNKNVRFSFFFFFIYIYTYIFNVGDVMGKQIIRRNRITTDTTNSE